MRDELLHKIQCVLDKRITSEMKVVYLLVELRKLMDRENYHDPILRTFANWIVHTSLENRADGSTLILKEFDDYIAEIWERQNMLPHPEHLSLSTFQGALIRCFNHFGLSAPFVKKLAEWKKFSKLYCSVVSECPIIFTASKTGLKYVKQVELQRIDHTPGFKEWPAVQWRLTFQNGDTQHWLFHM